MEVKGLAIAIFEPFITEKFGPEGYQRWLAALDHDSRDILGRKIDNGRWYPLRAAYSRPTEVLCRLFYDGDPRGAWELGRFSADHAFNWFFKSIIKLTTVQNFIMRATNFLTHYYHPVSMEVVSAEEGRLVYRITQFPESDPYVEHRIAGWNQRTLEIHNCRQVKVDLSAAISRGDPYTELSLTWAE